MLKSALAYARAFCYRTHIETKQRKGSKMVQTKAISKAVKGEVIGLTVRGFGSQWCVVHSVEVGEEKTAVKVQLPSHCSNAIIMTVTRKNDKRVNWQPFEEFDAWCKMYNLDRRARPE
ncbi:hypothetical protein PHYNN_78 [Pantoea phage Phynn]|nr:hypothetical protein PHYNN_78 [Pantoea phage Phynn]